jgi:hypothetical protein
LFDLATAFPGWPWSVRALPGRQFISLSLEFDNIENINRAVERTGERSAKAHGPYSESEQGTLNLLRISGTTMKMGRRAYAVMPKSSKQLLEVSQHPPVPHTSGMPFGP